MARLNDKININKVIKEFRNSGEEPTLQSSKYKSDGTWLDTDIYKSQIAINIEDDKIWYANNSGITEIMTDNDLSWISNNFVNKSGDTMTGDLTLETSLNMVYNNITTSAITFDGSTATGLKLTNANGYITLTPLNAYGWAHIYTGQDKFIFNKPVYSVVNSFNSYNNDLKLCRSTVTKLLLGTSTSTFYTDVVLNTSPTLETLSTPYLLTRNSSTGEIEQMATDNSIKFGNNSNVGSGDYNLAIGGNWANISYGTYNVSIGGYAGQMNHNGSTASNYNILAGGYNNHLENDNDMCGIFGGRNGEIADGVNYSTIIGGNGITATQDNTVYVENLNIDASPTTSTDTTPTFLTRNETSGNIEKLTNSSWINVPNTTDWHYKWHTIQYMKTADGTVFIRGTAEAQSSSASSVIFTLPTGYRPPDNMFWALQDYTGSNPTRHIKVGSNGAVEYKDTISSGDMVSFTMVFHI